jgi:hypothetical protein
MREQSTEELSTRWGRKEIELVLLLLVSILLNLLTLFLWCPAIYE